MNGENTQAQNARNRRRSYLVNPAFQWKYAIMLGIGVFLTTSILSCTLFASLQDEARHRFINPTSANLDTGLMILVWAFGFSLLTSGTVITLSVITSHRICGPLFVLEGYFKQIVSGKIPTPRPLRKKDEFKDIFQSFVRATEQLKVDQRKQFHTYQGLLALAHDAGSNDQSTSTSAIQSLANDLTKLHAELAKALDIERKPIPSEGESRPELNETPEPAHASA